MIEEILGFKVVRDWKDLNYLGVPIFLRRVAPYAWKRVLDKIKSKIVNWGGIWLNNMGRTILVKLVLSAIPLYQLSILHALKYVIHKLGIDISKFLWEGRKKDNKKFHLVN